MRTHAIIIDKSISNQELFEDLQIIGQKKALNNPWVLYKVDLSVNTQDIVNKLQKFLVDKFYFHYYTEKEIIVVFPKKIFHLTHDKNTWQECIAYGISIGIPKEQLDIKPSNFEEELY